MKDLFKKISRIFVKSKWHVVESFTGYWTISSSQWHYINELVFYIFEFNDTKNEYRLRWEGKQGNKHSMYGEMLQRLAELNNGATPNSEPLMSDSLFNLGSPDDISIISMPLENNQERAEDLETDDENLVSAVTEYLKTIEKEEDLEVFERKSNILVTNKGYYIAVYNRNIDIVDEEDEN